MHCCCTDCDIGVTVVHSRPPRNTTPTPWARRIATVVQWALPLATLTLVPKCPACVAGYVLLFTGIGLSLPAAAAVRWTLIVISITSLGYLLRRAARLASLRTGSLPATGEIHAARPGEHEGRRARRTAA